MDQEVAKVAARRRSFQPDHHLIQPRFNRVKMNGISPRNARDLCDFLNEGQVEEEGRALGVRAAKPGQCEVDGSPVAAILVHLLVEGNNVEPFRTRGGCFPRVVGGSVVLGVAEATAVVLDSGVNQPGCGVAVSV